MKCQLKEKFEASLLKPLRDRFHDCDNFRDFSLRLREIDLAHVLPQPKGGDSTQIKAGLQVKFIRTG